MLKKLFILAIFVIPFNDFYGLLPIGELQHEFSAYLFFVLMVLVFVSFIQNRKSKASASLAAGSYEFMPKMMAILLGVVLFSFLTNFPAMFGSSFHGRTPIEKFITSTLVVFYGFGVAYVSRTFGDKYSWSEIIIWPVTISVLVCMGVSVIEMLSWNGGITTKLYNAISSVIHIAYVDEGVSGEGTNFTGRSRSICFEPPALANFAGFAWPWVYAGLRSPGNRRKLLYFVALILCTVLVLVANSRTSYVLLAGNIATLFLLRTVYLPAKPQNPLLQQTVSILLKAGAVVAILFLFYKADAMVTYVTTTNNESTVSNITRLASMTGAFHMFFDRPITGYGFGQYGFHIVDYMPPWGYQSWEVVHWFGGSDFGHVWPPVFSIYARFAAELGILGLVLWPLMWVYAARTVWRFTREYQRRTGQLFMLSYPLIMSCYTALFSGIALDSLRTPMMWISLGLSACYVHDVRSRLKQLDKEKATIPAAVTQALA